MSRISRYYFASPKIEPDTGRDWNRDLFGKYSLFYIEAFSDLVNSIARSAKERDTVVEFFYPSSVFVDQPAKGFAEYAVAKASGEALCRQLQSVHANARFHAPRLPRMATDQTTSIIPLKSESTLSVMLEQLNRLAITGAAAGKQARL